MGDTLKKVQAGDPLRIPAPTWNALVDLLRTSQAETIAVGCGPTLAIREVFIRNDSGAGRERFEVLGIDAPIFTPTDSEEAFKDRVALKGVTPTEADHLGRFLILAEPVKAGEVCRAWAFGVCPVKVNVTDQAHRFADVADGVAGHLASDSTGAATILWKESGTGEKWAIVHLGHPLDQPAEAVKYGVLAAPALVTLDDWSELTLRPCARTGGLLDGEDFPAWCAVPKGWRPPGTDNGDGTHTVDADTVFRCTLNDEDEWEAVPVFPAVWFRS